jgi:hypothetical protein
MVDMTTAAEAGVNALERRTTALHAASFGYGFLVRRFPALVRLCLAPFAAVAIVQYLSLRTYLSELMTFIASGDARPASLALGAFAAGLFITVFTVAVAVSAVVDLVLERPITGRRIPFRMRRQEWRLYAAYLRLLLLAAGYSAVVYLASVFVLPLAGFEPSLIGVIAGFVLIAGYYGLFARVGFLIPPIVALSTGTVLRKALRSGGRDLPRNAALIVLLCIPGLLIEIFGEYLLRLGSEPVQLDIDLPVSFYARALENGLMKFVLLSSFGGMITLILLTVAAMVCYQDYSVSDSDAADESRAVAKLDSAPV